MSKSNTVTKKQYTQYSKRIMTFVAVSWLIFRLAALGAMLIQPNQGTAQSAFLKGSDDIMVVSIGFYTGNSVVEKGIVGYFQSKQDKPADEYEDEEL